jgi:predicted short-subunit dehydrogenase-like oxidoreductase (DUF2520 family)
MHANQHEPGLDHGSFLIELDINWFNGTSRACVSRTSRSRSKASHLTQPSEAHPIQVQVEPDLFLLGLSRFRDAIKYGMAAVYVRTVLVAAASL